MTERKVTVELTARELTDIRVAIFHRMDVLNKTISLSSESADLKAIYARLHAMMEEGGVLYNAMKESTRHRDIV